MALAGIGTAVTLYPVVKRQNEGVALGFVTIADPGSRHHLRRRREPALDRDPATGRTPEQMQLVTGQALAAQYHWTFLLGQALLPGINALLLGSLMYKSRLVPRCLPLLGLIGAPIIFASVIAKYFGVYDELSVWSGLACTPDRRVGVLARRLPDRQRLQALRHHRRNDRSRHPAHQPRRHRLTTKRSCRFTPKTNQNPSLQSLSRSSPSRQQCGGRCPATAVRTTSSRNSTIITTADARMPMAAQGAHRIEM